MKYPATTALVVTNVAAFGWQQLTGGFTTEALVAHGALVPVATLGGQWWRLYTSGFLHGGLGHIALNMFALYQIGAIVEALLGSGRMLAVYLIAMTGGSLGVAYFAGPETVTVGASGAIFGLFGALLAIGLRLGSRGKQIISQTLPILVINLVFTFAIPFISKEGHLGGLASGFLAGLLFFGTRATRDPVVVDRQTGVETRADYLPPNEPSGPVHTSEPS